MKNKVYLGITMILLMVCTQTGCQTIAQPGDERTQVIDQAILEIKQIQARWAEVLQHLPSQLPDHIGEGIQEEAQRLARRSTMSPGTPFHCSLEFLGSRAIQGLERIKEMILGNPAPSPLSPALCQVTPNVVDLGSDLSNWKTVTIHGYDLDQGKQEGNPLNFYLINEDHSVIEPIPESFIERVTHSQISLHLRDLANTLHTKNIYQIVPSWKGNLEGPTTGEVIVKAWKPKRKKVAIRLEKSTFIPPHVIGDHDFHTRPKDPTYGFVSAEVEADDHAIRGYVQMNARQKNGDKTQAQGKGEFVLYEFPDNWKLIQVEPLKPSKKPYFLTKRGAHSFNQPAGQAVQQFNIYSERQGSNTGDYTRVEVDWRPITIEVEEIRPAWMTSDPGPGNDGPEVEITHETTEEPKILIKQ